MEGEEALDLAIVGLGPAGLYAAWRIATADPSHRILGRPTRDLRVGLFDTMSVNRIGGRLCTQPLPGHPFLAELGGMRFRSEQYLMQGLVDALDLRKQVQPFAFDQHFFYLRGKRLREDALRTAARTVHPYDLADSERGKLPSDLIRDAIHNTLASLELRGHYFKAPETTDWGGNSVRIEGALKHPNGLEALSERERALALRYGEYRKEDLLYNVGFWDLLQFQLSSEGWHYAHDGLGYESIMGNWNSAIAVPWFLSDFASTDAWRLEEGMSAIPKALYGAVQHLPNFESRFGWDLRGLDASLSSSGDELVRLDFTDGVEKKVQYARAVILALPKGALIRLAYGDRLIDKARIPDDETQRRTWFFDQLNSVESRPLFKLFLGYTQPWWEDAPVTGKVNTDLPLRQVYYYGQDQWNVKRAKALDLSPEKNRHAMVMASYSDSHYIEFWTEQKKPDSYRYVGLENGRCGLSAADRHILEEFGAPRNMIVRAEHQLGLLHGKQILQSQTQPLANLGLYMEWSRPPYYAGWHSWKVSVKPWEVGAYLAEPFAGLRIAICGEAYSDEQGWTEGALKSAERVLQSDMFDAIPMPEGILKARFDGDTMQLRRYVGILYDKMCQSPKV